MFNTIHDKTNYDLALIYAKAKLEEAMSTNQFEGSSAPIDIELLEYLHDEFTFALDYYSNSADIEE